MSVSVFKFKLKDKETGILRPLRVFAPDYEAAKLEAARIAKLMRESEQQRTAVSRERKTTVQKDIIHVPSDILQAEQVQRSQTELQRPQLRLKV